MKSILELIKRKLVISIFLSVLALGFGFIGAAYGTVTDPSDPTLDGKADLTEADFDLGDYNGIVGGKFPPPGNAINGSSASGGTFRFLDDGQGIFDSFNLGWAKDGFHSNQQGIAFTLRNNGIAVWDNNGIEDGSYATINKVCLGGPNFRNACDTNSDCPGSTCSSSSFYEEAFGSLVQVGCCTSPRSDNGQIGMGRNHTFGMSNFLDFIYATRVELLTETTIDEIIAYFDGDGPTSYPFDPEHPRLKYRINIWSASTADPLLPSYDGTFVGDVMSTDSTPGTFTRSDTGVKRNFPSTTTSLINDPIFRLTWRPDNPIVLSPGVYYFSHDVRILRNEDLPPRPIPTLSEWSLIAMTGILGIIGVLAIKRRKVKA